MKRCTVEILYFEGCPHWQDVRVSIQEALEVLGTADTTDIHLVAVQSEDEAIRLRFLGSPTVRVDGRDVDPEAQTRHDYGLQCRVYADDDTVSALPPMSWIRDALRSAS